MMTTDQFDLPPLSALRTFEVFGRIKGIRNTAQALGVDPAAVSRQLQAIEAWFGMALIDRGRQPADLNERGRAYHARVSQSFFELRSATDDIRSGEDRNCLKVSCAHGLAHCWLIHHIHLFKARYPEIRLDLRPTDVVDYEKDDICLDVRFFIGDEANMLPPHLRSYKLIRCEARPVASPEFISELPAQLTPADLLAQPLLDCSGGVWWSKWFACQGVTLPAEDAFINCWHMDFALSMARRGDGITLATPFIVWPDDASGDLRSFDEKLVGVTPLYGTYHLVEARRRSSWRSVQAFRRWIHDLMQNPGGKPYSWARTDSPIERKA